MTKGFITLFCVSCAIVSGAEIKVFAAASLSDALREIAPAYEAASGHSVRYNLASSSALARQIKEGAPADVFFSADEAKMDALEKEGLVAVATRHTVLSNTLVVVVHADAQQNVDGVAALKRPGVRRIALAEPETVPAGIYAREYLARVQLWDQVQGKVVRMENVRAALAAVEAGNADVAIVYKTDALISKRVRIVHEVPREEGPKIAYPLAVMSHAKEPEAARAFADYLRSEKAQAVFAKYGFLPAP